MNRTVTLPLAGLVLCCACPGDLHADGQSHGVGVTLSCESPLAPMQQLDCETTMLYGDGFGDTIEITEAYVIIDPNGAATRVPPVGNAPAAFLGNARFAGVPGELPIIIGAAGSTLNGLPGNPLPGAAVFQNNQYTIQLSDPELLTVRASVVATDLCDALGSRGCFSFPNNVQFTTAILITNLDCNGNGVVDSEDISLGTSPDCNGNVIPDECDEDVNGDGVVDDCDCNANGVLDADDIAAGGNADDDGDGVPDECDAFAGAAIWNSIGGGLFDNSVNWVPNVPGPFNEAVFNLSNATPYTVLLDRDAESSRVTISDGTVIFDLDGFRYDLFAAVTPGLVISGLAGDAISLQLAGGGTMAGGACQIASASGSLATLEVSGPGTALELLENLCIGCPGTGTLRVLDGATVFCRDANLGELAGSGTVEVAGIGSTLVAPFFIIVDGGTLDVGFGATVTAGFNQFGGVFLLEDGELIGDGTVEGTVINFGRVVPGVGGEPLTIDGGYIQVGTVPGLGPASGTFTASLDTPGGGAPLVVIGNAELGGGLFTELAPGADPGAGDGSFALVDATSVTDRFDVAFFPGLDGRILRVQYPGAIESGPPIVAINVESFQSLLGFDTPGSTTIDGTPVDVVVTQLDDESGSPPDLAIVLPDADPQAPGELLVLFDVQIVGGAITIGVQQNLAVGVRPTAVAAGDLDGNGIADLVVTDGGDDDFRVFLTGPDRSLPPGGTVPTGDDPRDVAIADFNGDTFLDVVVASYGDSTVQEFFNDGVATLIGDEGIDLPGRPTAIDPETVDDDKDLDMVVVLQNANAVVIPNGGDAPQGLAGIGATIPVGAGPVDVIVIDLDGQETSPGVFPPEIVTVNESGDTVSVIINNGGLDFEPAVNLPVGSSPSSITAVDLDQDGDAEIAVVAGDQLTGGRVVKVLRNDTDGGNQLILADAEAFDFGDDPVLVASGDLDADGDDDLIAINESVGGTPFAGPASATLNGVPNTLFAPPCPADSNGDGEVDVDDLNAVILDWGTDGSVNGGDLTDVTGTGPPDGIVNVNDLNAVIMGWGDCP